MPGLYNEWLDPETTQFVNTVAIGITQANDLMKQVHNTKLRMPTILTEDLAWEWLMEKPGEERLQLIARTQIPSRLLEYCTIDPDYRKALEATPRDFNELPALNTSYLYREELEFDHWPADLVPFLEGEEEGTMVDEIVTTYYPPGMNPQADFFS